MAEVTSSITEESIYDSSLTYEQRAELRRQRRKERARMSVDLSSERKRPPLQNGILQNGSVTGRASRARTTSPIGHNRLPTSPLPFKIPQQSQKLENPNTKHKANSSTTVESTRTRYSRLNSESSIQSKPSKSPPVLRANSFDNVLDKRPSSPHSPLTVRLASSHLKGIIDRHQERERSCSPMTPSPLSTPTTVIPSHKQAFFTFPEADSDAKSSYTSSGDSTLTPGLSTSKGDKTDSTVTEQKLLKTGPTSSAVMTSKPREDHQNGTSSPEPIPSKVSVVQSSNDSGHSKSIQPQNSTPVSTIPTAISGGSKSTSEQVLSAFNSWDNIGSADTSSTTMASHLDGSAEKGVGTEHVTLPTSNGQTDKESSVHELLPTQQQQHPPSREQSNKAGEMTSSAATLKPPPGAVPVPAAAAVGLDEFDGGRVSRQSTASEASSWEFESFQWGNKEPINEVHPMTASSKPEANFDPLGFTETPVSLSSNAPKFTSTSTGLMEHRGMEVESLDEANFVNVITIGGMSQCDPLSPELGQGDLLMQGVNREELLGSSVEGICGHHGAGPKSKEEGKKSSAAKSKKSEPASPHGSGKKSKGSELPGSGGKKSKESKKGKEKESGRGRTSSSEKTPEKKLESKSKGQANKTSSDSMIEMKPHGSLRIKAFDSIRSNPIPLSPSVSPFALRKGSASFRDNKGVGGYDISNSGLSKASLPNLFSPTSGSSREGTPDRHLSSSATSEDDSPKRSKQKKEKLPLRKRLSLSMKSLLDRDGSKATTSKTAWTFSEVPFVERSRGLFSAQSELQLSVLTEKDRESLLADTELIPRTYSMECLPPAEHDRSLDGPGIEKPTTFDRASSGSDSEYLTASDSEPNDYIHSSISILSVPTDTTRDAGYGGATKDSLQSVSSSHLPQQSPQLQLQTSRARGKEVPMGDNETTPKNSPEAAKKKRAMTTAGALQAPASPRSRAKTTSGPSQSLSSTSIPSLSNSGSNGPSNFSRFSKGRVPIRKPSVSKSPHAAEPPKSSLSERVERIKQQRRAESLSVSKPITVRKSPTSSPVPSKKALSTSKLPSISRSPKSGSPVASPRTISVPKSPVISRTHSNSSPVPPRGSLAVLKSPVTSRTPPKSSSPLPVRKTISASKSPSRTPPKTTPTGSRKNATTRSPVPKTKAAKGMEIQAKKEREPASRTNKASATTTQVKGTDVNVDIDSLLASVGQQLDKLEVSSPSETPEFDVSKLDTQNSVRILPLESEHGSGSVPVAENPVSPPFIASMPAFVFSAASPLHSRESSYDVDPNLSMQESYSPPEVFVTPNTSPQPPRRMNDEPRLQKPATAPLPISDTKKQRKSPILGILRRKTAPGPPTLVTAASKEKASIAQLPRAKNPSPTPQRREVSTGRRPISISTTHPPAPTVKSDSNLLMQRTSSSSRTSSFTAALPPKPPSMKKHESESVLSSPSRKTGASLSSGKVPSSHITVTTTATAAGRPKPAGGTRDTTNLTRPTGGTGLRSSQRKSTPSTVSSSSSSTSGVKSKSSTPSLLDPKGSLARSSIRGSARKKTSTVVPPKHFPKAGPSRPIIPLSKTYSDEKALGSKSAMSLLRSSPERASSRGSKLATSLSRPSSARTASSRKVSSNTYSTSLSQPAGDKSSAVSPARHSMRRVSSGEMIARKSRSGASGSLNRRERRQSGGSSTLNRPMSRSNSGSALRPQSASTVRGSTATKSMRLSRTERKIIGTGTLPRTSTLTRKATPPSSVAGSVQSSPGRLTMRRSQSGKDVFAVFDQISAEAQDSILPSSDHRRLVRPKLRQKASTSHLKMLQNRKDVSSELSSAGHTDSSTEAGRIDPNTYSTYMAKKNLAPSAIAGLASKLDLSTVKLRKTGIVEQMLSEQAGGVVDNRSASPNPAMGMDYNTSHSVMMIQIKGRRLVQSRLVEPSAAALNSGDVFIAVSGKQLFHWIGKSANVIEKARGSDVVMRILHKRELGCHATQAITLKEGDREAIEGRRDAAFWELLGGKKGVKSSESVPSDEVHEKAVTMATRVYQLEGEGEKLHYSLVHENMAQMVRVALLNPKKILLFDFFSEVYVWIGKQTPTSQRKKALEMGREHFDTGCRLPVFAHQTASPARSSGRYRPKSPRISRLNSSGRKSKKSMDRSQRPTWGLFSRVNEGSEPILFREKFADWPEPGRIIKMKGHRETTPPTLPAELQPADVSKMLKPTPAFEGLRLEGDNIYRGQGNYKVSRSTFACNRVRTHSTTKWVIKEFDNVLIPDQDHGLFYSMEAYVIRWAYIITVVRELEGLTPGQGPFARDRQYQKSLLNSNNGGGEVGKANGTESGRQKQNENESDSESEVDSDDECRKILESGGRDRCAYYFWQGDTCTVNEKGASALMTVELDKEKGPQIRVVEGKEPPAFLSLFGGGMIILLGKSETHSLQSPGHHLRLFCVRVHTKNEACLVEVNIQKKPIASQLRSRGCYVLYHRPSDLLYLWQGSKVSHSLKKSAVAAAKMLKNRLQDVELVTVQEGAESNDLCTLLGDRNSYHSLAHDSRFRDYTPRLFELTSTTGEFTASEVIYPARTGEAEPFHFLQRDLYSTVQPAIFLLDAHYEVYVWLGWWPEQKNQLLREANATTGSAHSRWLRDKRLALETAQLYVKGCNRTRTPKAYMVTAGTEHERFINQFPFWEVNERVQELNCKTRRRTPWRVEVDEELKKYSRTRFTLEELKKRPLPEGVDPAKLETFLSDDDFKKVFRMAREHFQTLSNWKQANLKKQVSLF